MRGELWIRRRASPLTYRFIKIWWFRWWALPLRRRRIIRMRRWWAVPRNRRTIESVM
jgi:hypothetical protein